MNGLAAAPIINDINNIISNIDTIKNNINDINSDISSLQNNKANKYYNYQKIGLISDNDNLNNYRTIGSYTMTTAGGATTLSNLPSSASAGTLHVINVLGDSKTLTGKAG